VSGDFAQFCNRPETGKQVIPAERGEYHVFYTGGNQGGGNGCFRVLLPRAFFLVFYSHL
jgi:hypothetical protein